ncbi:MAG: cation-transporting P-type ATPase [bacterium]|nr:cation-transporting P-type ATPase [bacterium]
MSFIPDLLIIKEILLFIIFMDQREFYIMEASQVCEDLHTSMTGLDIDERKKRQEIYGQNILQNLHKKNQLLMFFLQFKDLMIVLLIVSSGIALVLNDVSTAIILGAIVLINACIGFFQEAKAEHELESLKKMVSTKAKVKIG